VDVPGIGCSAPGLHFTGKRYLDKLYLLVTNPDAAPVDAVFTLPSAIHARVARLAGTSQPLVLHGMSVHLPLGGIDSSTVIFDL